MKNFARFVLYSAGQFLLSFVLIPLAPLILLVVGVVDEYEQWKMIKS